MKIDRRRLMDQLNVPKHISDHMFGEEHSDNHRVCVGIGIAILGVCIANIHFEFIIIHYLFDGVGYFLHGVGIIPIIDKFEKAGKPKKKEQEKEEA